MLKKPKITMKYPIIEIVFEKEIESEKKILIEKYWSFENKTFLNRPTEINLEYKITQHRLNQSLEYSEYYLNFGNCTECNLINKIRVRNQTEANLKINNCYYHFFCSVCRTNLQNELKFLDKINKKNLELNYSFKHKLWEKLNYDEYTFLRAINKLKTWEKINKEILEKYKKYCFENLTKLKKMNLINYNGQEEIFILPELGKILEENKILNIHEI